MSETTVSPVLLKSEVDYRVGRIRGEVSGGRRRRRRRLVVRRTAAGIGTGAPDLNVVKSPG